MTSSGAGGLNQTTTEGAQMGRLIVTEFVSLDGVMEAPGGEPGYAHSGWTMEFPDGGQYVYKLDETLAADVLLLGRVTYQSWAAVWPEEKDGAGFADKLNAMPKYVVSTTLGEATWNNSTILRDLDAVRQLKADAEGIILVAGSATLVHGLLAEDLVDELRLMVFPVILGSGRRVFPETPDKQVFELIETRTYDDSGVEVHAYRRPGR
jgi:dihydrofolate reductase